MKLNLKVVTPVKMILSDEIDELTLPTTSGEISVLPNHIDLLTKVSPGEMVIKKGGKIENFAITGGFLEISNNNATLLADYVIRATDIEVAKAKEAKERAEKKLSEKQGNKDFVVAQAELRKALLELKVANRRRVTS
ncbi:MAG: ATP synthase F1 subunit epsilon [Candidatus Levybacteria bacterium RIFCSPHIGHO2_01_FULL_37_17]|nr:MAG: ATP synthase F1 subunit epsilon [Candidatus Levybacteria bacterium RIFCSPHIGHO2_01_FULL_37_17]OGH36703.1 MAG: ATP synthase F1 subunit epsilon [Candidatus Levybacteria bacterium RIFCSPLOWO2_01_FULL_38_23]